MLRCDSQGIAFSTGAACHGAEQQPAKKGKQDHKPDNHVLAAIGMSAKQAREVIRVSFCGHNTIEEAERTADVLVQQAQALRAMAPRRG